MPRSKEGHTREKIDVNQLILAIEAVRNGSPVRVASRQYNIARTTLQRHLDAHQAGGNEIFSYTNRCAVWKVFSDEEEQQLVDYIITASNMHYGLSRKEVVLLAYQFAKELSKKYPTSWDVNGKAGEQWLTDFMRRHQNMISLRKPQPTSLSRSIAFNKPVIAAFFEKFTDVIEKHKLGAQQIYNMDESGLSTVHNPPKVLSVKGRKQVGCVTSAERGVNVTLIGCINALGNSIPPVLIFPRVNFKTHMLHGAPPESLGVAHPSGWSNSEIFLQFLDHFTKHVKPSTENRVLLLLDNHDSHITIPAINKAKENGIIMLTFPPHTSHKLQPLDRGVFGPFKKFYNVACNNWMHTNPGKPITIYDVGHLTGVAYPSAFSPSNIQSGFRVAGLYPLNPSIFREDEYLSSFVTDKPMPGVQAEKAQEDIIGGPSNESSRSQRLLEEIRPFPKAQMSKPSRKRRKLGRSRVLTDTPEKNEIENAQNEKKKSNKVNVASQIFKEVTDKHKIRKETPEESSSEEEVTSHNSDDESIVSFQELARRYEEEELQELFLDSTQPLEIGKWVLVAFATKKTKKHYIGVIQSLNTEEPTVKFARRVKNTSTFVWPHTDDISEIPSEDIITFLPQPTIGRRGTLMFGVSFTGLNVN